MKVFAKSALFSALGVGCLAVGSGAQSPPPPAPPAPAAPLTGVVVAGEPADVIRFAPAQGAGGYGGTATFRPGQTTWALSGFGDDGKARELAKKLADAKDSDDKDKLRGQLRDVLSKAFEERQKAHEKQIEQLEAQVKKLKDLVGKRADAKKEIIDGRITQLQKEAQGLGW